MSLLMDYHHDPVTMAKRLLGQRLVRVVDGQRVSGLIVEVEAYLGEKDRAAHSYRGRRTPRNESMYLPGGYAYVYLIYGIHHCLNVVCGEQGEGVAVLIRAVKPEEGVDLMRSRRSVARSDIDLCSGPGKLAEAMAIDRELDGHDLRSGERLFIEQARAEVLSDATIAAKPRIGVDYAGAWASKRLRFMIARNEYVSRR